MNNLPMVFVDGIKVKDVPAHKLTNVKIESGDQIIDLVFPEVLLTDLFMKLKVLYVDHNGMYTKTQVKAHMELLIKAVKEIVAQDSSGVTDIIHVLRDLNREFVKEEDAL